MNKRLETLEKGNTKMGKLQRELLYLEKGMYINYSKEYTADKISMIEKEIDALIADKKAKEDRAAGSLVEMLKEQTQSLKTQYIDKCVIYAENEYVRLKDEYAKMRAISGAYCDEWNNARCEGIDKKAVEEKYSKIVVEKGYVNGTTECTYYYKTPYAVFCSKKNKLHSHQVFSNNLADYLVKAEKNAKLHYENSILRLALRIEKKELNQAKLEMTTSHIDVNISTTITDGDKTVRAWTIIAEGPIQRPHYRYLVK